MGNSALRKAVFLCHQVCQLRGVAFQVSDRRTDRQFAARRQGFKERQVLLFGDLFGQIEIDRAP